MDFHSHPATDFPHGVMADLRGLAREASGAFLLKFYGNLPNRRGEGQALNSFREWGRKPQAYTTAHWSLQMQE